MPYPYTGSPMIPDYVICYSEAAASKLDPACPDGAAICNCVSSNYRHGVFRKRVSDVNLSSARIWFSGYLVAGDCYLAASAVKAGILKHVVVDHNCRVERGPPRVVPDTHGSSGRWTAYQAIRNATTGSRYGNADVSEVFHFDCVSHSSGPVKKKNICR